MIMGIFGLPGAGKSTFLTQLAKQYQKKGLDVFINSEYPIDGCYIYNWQDIGVYDMSNSIILIDEVSMYADNRDFKKFNSVLRDFFISYRHYNCDVIWCTQQYDGVDRKIRELTSMLYYIRPARFLRGFSYATMLQRVLYVPSMKDIKQYPNSTITTKWAKVGILRLLTSPIQKQVHRALRLVYRPRYYKYFDSYETKPLRLKKFRKHTARPAIHQETTEPKEEGTPPQETPPNDK